MHACPAPLLPPCPSLFSRVAASLQQPVSPFLPPNRPPSAFMPYFIGVILISFHLKCIYLISI